jgi:UDP-glucose:(heptosyl)LPS alpha-1,3-glucosyltransferase
MKIAVVRQRYNPYGGAERFVERALGALVKEGAEVTLITRSWEGAEIRANYQQVICNPKASGRVARDRSFARCAQQAMASGGFDITQSHERIPGCMVFRAGDGVHAAWLTHLRRVRGLLGRFGLTLNPYHRYVLAAEREMFAHPDLRAIICNSRMVREEIMRYYNVPEEKLHVIYNGVDIDSFHPDLAHRHRSEVRAAHGMTETTPLFLFVGNGFERKGVPQLLRAFAVMQNKTSRLAIVGGDKKLGAMRKLAFRLGLGERVLFVGPQKDVKPWYGAADAFVLPTLYDPFPNAALEAMACSLPVLTSPGCGAAELIAGECDGFVCDALDTATMAGRLDQLACRPSTTADRLLISAKIANFSLERMAERLTTLYHTLSNTPNTRPGHLASKTDPL